ncbi:hypothetical protein [Rhodoferax sp. BLA1]|uniref:hypothetical protein n=1 Tax=Rhodoferax sp. BLA1 TaxID=2576062 RepID=UPI0015D2ED69|nr:hypothetical protein [Rhodoferax sp. BLA1]
MKRLTATLVTDGSSDRLLVPLIELLLDAHTDLAYQVNCADGLPPASAGLTARIATALALFPCDILFVHRDAEGIDPIDREREIESSWPKLQPLDTLICVVPVRMTEAWLLTDERPIRAAVGNANGRDDLGLPALKDIESLPDPKKVLFGALEVATGKNASRKRRFNPHQYRHRVSELMEDLKSLRKLKSFRHLEAQIQKHLADFKL